ncbi:hypothetical protein ACOJBZ_17060 [Enterococcus innesii]|uniref:hypothetical protein n=1 Tax=Enterococcus innesii TaxID=2839759 RepID=UPI003B591C6C
MKKLFLLGLSVACFGMFATNTQAAEVSEPNQYFQSDGSIFIPEGETPTIFDSSDQTNGITPRTTLSKTIKGMRSAKNKADLPAKIYQEVTITNAMGFKIKYAGNIPRKSIVKSGNNFTAYYEGVVGGTYVK